MMADVAQYTREWFTYHLVKLNDLFWSMKFENFEALLDEEELVGKAIAKITGLGPDDVADLLVKKLMVSEEERQTFFAIHNIPCGFANICEQMIAYA